MGVLRCWGEWVLRDEETLLATESECTDKTNAARRKLTLLSHAQTCAYAYSSPAHTESLAKSNAFGWEHAYTSVHTYVRSPNMCNGLYIHTHSMNTCARADVHDRIDTQVCTPDARIRACTQVRVMHITTQTNDALVSFFSDSHHQRLLRFNTCATSPS